MLPLNFSVGNSQQEQLSVGNLQRKSLPVGRTQNNELFVGQLGSFTAANGCLSILMFLTPLAEVTP